MRLDVENLVGMSDSRYFLLYGAAGAATSLNSVRDHVACSVDSGEDLLELLLRFRHLLAIRMQFVLMSLLQELALLFVFPRQVGQCLVAAFSR